MSFNVICGFFTLFLKLCRINLFFANQTCISYLAVNSFEFSYSKFELSLNIGVPRLPIVGSKANKFFSAKEHVIPPIISGMNSVVKKLSITLIILLMFGVIHI